MPQWLANKLIAYGITVGVGLIAYILIRRTRVDPNKRASLTAIKRQAEVSAGVPAAIYGLCAMMAIALAVLLHAPWWVAILLVPVAIWGAWWLPSGRRRISSHASILVEGMPARVSAFVADLPGQAKWSPGTVSCIPQLQGPRGPRYLAVERMPDGREIEGVVTLTRDEPGHEVDIEVEGAGATGDYYSFAAQEGGTLVTKRTIVELPYVLAVVGGMFMGGGLAADAQQRRVNELGALKSAFESGGF